ncbi:MAG: peptidoglycan-binding protein [Clostridia bacterium]|nr:peptidoglycan-binding protein [Clostridia bacterium]
MNTKKAFLALGLLSATAVALSGCAQIDESLLDSNADFSVNIAIPYTTTTPLPDYMSVPEQVVIDPNGGVTVNDASLLTSSLNNSKAEESQYTSLSLGDTKPSVTALQERLSALGYCTGGVSGVFDAATETAVKRFEQTYGVMQTGIATPAFQVRLFAQDAPVYGSEAYDSAVVSQYTTLQRGAVGSTVYALQHRLKELGYPIRDLTGVYDEETENAIRLFSEAYGLKSQSIAYIALQKELYSDNAIPYSESGSTQARAGLATLSLGNVGTQVMRMQSRLIELGYMTGTATGVFDAETEAAVRAFEETCGRAVTGVLDTSLQNLLLSQSAPQAGQALQEGHTLYSDLEIGSEGDEVLGLQNRLIELGYANGVGNGVYGEETANAVVLFEHYNGLPEDGRATGALQTYLYSSAALSYDAAVSGATPAITPEPTPFANNALGTLQGARTLSLNDTGDEVTKLQERLNSLGYECTVNGVYDQETQRAMMAFQQAVGVSQTGDASDTMLKYIYTKAAPASKYQMFNATQSYETLQLGDAGEAVVSLQWQLWTLGYLTTEDVEGSVGVFDDRTRSAVISTQLAMGYEQPDGVAGPEFQCFIFSEYNRFIKR